MAVVINDMQSKDRYVKNDALLWRRICDEIVIIYGDEIYNLKNESAIFLWNLIDGNTTLIGLAERLAKEFEINTGRAEVDVKEFIAALCNLGLIQGGKKHEKTKA